MTDIYLHEEHENKIHARVLNVLVEFVSKNVNASKQRITCYAIWYCGWRALSSK